MTDDPEAFTVGDLVGFCTRCGRQLNRHGECINLFCQQQAAEEPQARGYVAQVDPEAGRVAVAARAKRLLERVRERMPAPTGFVMAREDAKQLYHELGVDLSEAELDAMAIQMEEAVEISTRAHVDPRVANPVRRRPFAMGMDAARRLVVWIVMGETWSAWQRQGLVPT